MGVCVRGVRAVIAWGQRFVYGVLFRATTVGAENAPKSGAFLIAANHESHLDMGLIKHALGGRPIVSLAAKDYFFDNRLSAFVFRHFTNLLPFDRKKGLRESLESAGAVLAEGKPLLMFPEGTRTADGRMLPFKPALGYLALNYRVDVLPVYLDGPFEAMPKGAFFPRFRRLRAVVGPLIRHEELARAAGGLPSNEGYRAATAVVEAAVRRLSGCNETAGPFTDRP